MNPAAQDFSEQRNAAQFADKAAATVALFANLAPPVPELHASPAAHYRQRAEFRVWHAGDDLFYAMFDAARPGEPIRIDRFPPASLRINALMQALRDALLHAPVLRHRLFQVEFLGTLSGEALVTLIYHRALDDSWTDAARTLARALGVQLIGRSRKQRIVLGEMHVTERLALDDVTLELRQPEGCFTQPNAEVNRAMLRWARAACCETRGGLVELYCGIGNFTVALAPRFGRVLATEINKTATAAARHNLAANGITNTFLARLASHEVAEALAGTRPFRRLQGYAIGALDADTLFVDPPRAGLDEATRALAARFRRVMYVSCNPQTLHRDVMALSRAYRIERFALFDQFPYTHHLECGMVLERRSD